MVEQTKDNPLGNDLEPVILVIFGITGDLSKRKVLPAIYHLFKENLFPEHTEIIGTSRHELSVDDLLKDVELCVLETDNICDPDAIALFRSKLRMEKLDPLNGEDYDHLRERLDSIEAEHKVSMNRLFYLSIPPQVYGPVVRHLGDHGLNTGSKDGQKDSRLLVEKPFGYDLISAEDLITLIDHEFKEDQLFRIDHYLAKETSQNIVTFRRYNPLFASVWNNQHIKDISIIAAEQIGIEGRANFYEHIGAMRDLVQSHLLQLLAITTMDLPEDLTDSSAIHSAKEALLKSVKPPQADQITEKVIRAQYDGYREEVENPDSTTETFVSLQLTIDTPKWRDVPVTLTTGKALDSKRTEITICFGDDQDSSPNQLTFRVQPNEGIDVQLLVKTPGFAQIVQPASMDFSYEQTFDEQGHPDAYERVLIDAIRGDHALFSTNEEVLASWRVLQPILDTWQKSSADLKSYPKGSKGPDLT